jgi:tRNA A58 N-methylase Trm61
MPKGFNLGNLMHMGCVTFLKNSIAEESGVQVPSETLGDKFPTIQYTVLAWYRLIKHVPRPVLWCGI